MDNSSRINPIPVRLLPFNPNLPKAASSKDGAFNMHFSLPGTEKLHDIAVKKFSQDPNIPRYRDPAEKNFYVAIQVEDVETGTISWVEVEKVKLIEELFDRKVLEEADLTSPNTDWTNLVRDRLSEISHDELGQPVTEEIDLYFDTQEGIEQEDEYFDTTDTTVQNQSVENNEQNKPATTRKKKQKPDSLARGITKAAVLFGVLLAGKYLIDASQNMFNANYGQNLMLQKHHFSNYSNVAPDLYDLPHAEQIEQNLSAVQPGNWVIFKQVSKITQFATAVSQRLMYNQSSEDLYTATHAGIVKEVNKEEGTIGILEAQGPGKALKLKSYLIRDLTNNLDNDASIVFVDTSTSSFYNNSNMSLAIWNDIMANSSREGAPYNVESIFEMPWKSSEFSDNDKHLLTEGLLSTLGHPEASKPFFCSEHVLYLSQLHRIIDTMGPIFQQLKNDPRIPVVIEPQQRDRVVNYLVALLDAKGIWDSLVRTDPLFNYASRAVGPSKLLEIALEQFSTSVLRKPPTDKPQLTYGKLIKILEPHINDIPGDIRNGHVRIAQHLIPILLEILEQSGYSQDNLQCLITKCAPSSTPFPCIQDCLDTTLSDEEMVTIGLMSQQLNQVTESLLMNPNVIDFIRNPSLEAFLKIDPEKVDIDKFLNEAFPMPPKSSSNVGSSSEDIPAKNENDLTKDHYRYLAKYMPLALVYSPPTPAVEKFLNATDLDIVEISYRLHQLITYSSILTNRNNTADNLEVLWRLIIDFKVLQPENSWMQPAIGSLAEKSGYSNATVSCWFKNLASDSLDGAAVEQCLSSTLSIREKLGIWFSSHFIHYSVNELVNDPQFLASIQYAKDHPIAVYEKISKIKMSAEILNRLLPSTNVGPLRQAQNYIAKQYFLSSAETSLTSFLAKDFMLGYLYSPPTEALAQFQKEHDVSPFTLALGVMDFISGEHAEPQAGPTSH